MSKLLSLFTETEDLVSQIQKLENENLNAKNRIELNLNKIHDLELRLEDIRKEVGIYDFKVSVSTNIANNMKPYNKEWQNLKKAIWVLEQYSEPLSVKKIVEIIGEHDDQFKEKDKARELAGTLSSTLLTKCNRGQLFKRTQEYEGGTWLYSLL